MSNDSVQKPRVVPAASLADILGQNARRPVGKPIGLSSDPFGYDKARILSESTANNIDPRIVGLGSRMTVDRRFA